MIETTVSSHSRLRQTISWVSPTSTTSRNSRFPLPEQSTQKSGPLLSPIPHPYPPRQPTQLAQPLPSQTLMASKLAFSWARPPIRLTRASERLVLRVEWMAQVLNQLMQWLDNSHTTLARPISLPTLTLCQWTCPCFFPQLQGPQETLTTTSPHFIQRHMTQPTTSPLSFPLACMRRQVSQRQQQ